MKHLCTLTFLIAFAFLTGCSGPSYKQFNYEYLAPAEYPAVPEQSALIAIQVNGKDLGRPLNEFKHPLQGFTWTHNYNEADFLLSVKVDKTKVYKDVVTETTEEIINSNGKKERTKTYTYPGVIHTPYVITLKDIKKEQTVIQTQATYETTVSGAPQKSKKAAESSLALTARVKKSDSRKDALAHIHQQAQRLLDVQLTEHTKSMVFDVPDKDEAEPRIAQAFALLTTQPSAEQAQQALAIYQAIGTDNKNEKGEDNEDLNKAVHAGLAACYYILGDLAAYEENKALAKRTVTFSSTVTTNSSF